MTSFPVRAVRVQDQEPVPRDVWFTQVPAVAQVLREGWPLDQVTVLVGDNGAGKSTLVEAVAMMYGLGAEGGSTGSMHSTRRTESELWRYLRRSDWESLELVQRYRGFLDDPRRYLRHVIEDASWLG